jgi:hypothetical protein
VPGWRWVCSRAGIGDGIAGIPTGTTMMWFIKIMCTFRIPTLFPLPVVMEEGGAEVTSIVPVETTVRAGTTPPPQAVPREAEEQATDPARRRIPRWQIAVQVGWALQPPRAIHRGAREQVTDPARQGIVRPMRIHRRRTAVPVRWALQPAQAIHRGAPEQATGRAHRRIVLLMQIYR